MMPAKSLSAVLVGVVLLGAALAQADSPAGRILLIQSGSVTKLTSDSSKMSESALPEITDALMGRLSPDGAWTALYVLNRANLPASGMPPFPNQVAFYKPGQSTPQTVVDLPCGGLTLCW